ncbi:hypothetical protein Sme01_65170 [Sphaerisporangium melleum]|uniref:Transcription termination factor Rho n=1 Tax=Sphaerisporangium melleum TaxID=321316 RepID=A0A917RFB9_9ACTN|nr:transcription termination factor Rho [Sphaerisporangium melleum]GGL03594.1 hypothetical protein GCM10007964_52130 [Sphaerisporangium melleum]GII74041.1 hypothetical protein Sme01_65170 [Sphaerisporangium melleum]
MTMTIEPPAPVETPAAPPRTPLADVFAATADLKPREDIRIGKGDRPADDARRRNNRRADDSNAARTEVSGLLDVRDRAAFLRTDGHLPGDRDLRLPLAQVRALDLRPGDRVTARTTSTGVEVISVDGERPGRPRPHFAELTPVHPHERLVLATGSPITRVVDLLTPIGKGQRGLIVAPPKAGKTTVLKAIADAVARNHPGVHLMVVLVGERPEEVTDFQRSSRAEVIASTFDRPERDHVALAELAVERARRLAERGTDVMILLDSLTRLGRAYNTLAPSGGKTLSGGVDASALYLPKRLFGAARATEGAGSVTIIATALAETGSRMDDFFYEEFKGTGNMELRLSRALAEQRVFPAVDVTASGTRREELLLGGDEREAVRKLRRVLAALDREQAAAVLLDRLRETPSNAAFLRQIAAS